MKIGEIIKDERLKRNLTQEDLAKDFFVTRQLVSKWENNKSYPDLDQVVKISELFDLPLDYLLKGDQEMTDKLNFDSKLKNRLKWLSISLTVILGIIMLFAAVFWYVDSPLLNENDIKITKIEKIVLPAKTVTNPKTGQKWTLPEDVEYLIYFKADKPFVDLQAISGVTSRITDEGIEVTVNGIHKFGHRDTESKIWVKSYREENWINPSLNRGKDIYLYHYPHYSKVRKSPGGSHDPGLTQDYRLLKWSDLKKLPSAN